MTAWEWFERIRLKVLAISDKECDLEAMRAQAGVKGQSFGVAGHGGAGGDASAAVLRVLQAGEELEKARAVVNPEIDRALLVLYGRSGRGGLAKAKGSATADSICGYYLQGMTWREVADELVRPDSLDGEQWCRRRAYRGLEYIDRRGADRLADS